MLVQLELFKETRNMIRYKDVSDTPSIGDVYVGKLPLKQAFDLIVDADNKTLWPSKINIKLDLGQP